MSVIHAIHAFKEYDAHLHRYGIAQISSAHVYFVPNRFIYIKDIPK